MAGELKEANPRRMDSQAGIEIILEDILAQWILMRN